MPRSQSNLAWRTLLDLEFSPPGPFHLRLTHALRAAIRDGVLASASTLPPSRMLAVDLGCSRWAVTEAYTQLVAEGYLEARVGAGTRVSWRDEPPSLAPTPTAPGALTAGLDLAPGLPDLRAFPRTRWLASMRTATAALPYPRLGYPVPGGDPDLRRVLAAYLRRVRGAVLDPSELTICHGVTDAITRLCPLMRAVGVRAVAVEDPGWPVLREVVVRAGLEVAPVPVDRDGLRTDLLDRCPRVRAVVISPAHQFPTGAVLAPERRSRLIGWARRVDALIIEDDYDAEFRYDRRPIGTVQGMDPARVALAGSLSKTMSPGLGIGWLATPPRWTRRLRETDSGRTAPSIIDQLTFADFLESGGYDRHLRGAVTRYRTRRDLLLGALADHLPGSTVSGAAAGLHLLVQPGRGPTAPGAVGESLVESAARHGVRIACIEQYRVHNRTLDGALVLGYGNLTDHQIVPAVSRLAEAVTGARVPAAWRDQETP